MNIDLEFARLRTHSVSLSISTADLCCLLILRACEEQSAALPEREVLERLTHVHEQFSETENPRKRATHGLQRLLDQRLLTRVSLGGLTREGEYTLSSLGRGIIEFFVDEARLTRESLKVLTATLASQLTRVRDDARSATTEQDWTERVVLPITIASRSLLDGITRRTAGLDEEQGAVRADIARLLTEHWLDAMEQTQGILETMTSRLEELRDVILQEQKGLEAILDDVEGLAQAADAGQAERVVAELAADLANLSGWAVKRHDEWSDYYRSMLQTLRSLVRLDPDRALTQRMRDSLHSWPEAPWTLPVAPRLRIAVLRPEEFVVERRAAERPHRTESNLEQVPALADVQLDVLVIQALSGGATNLTQVLGRVLPELPERARFRDAGRIAEIVAKVAWVHSPLERDWVQVQDALLVEEWPVEMRR